MVKATYFQNDPIRPLVYDEVERINPPRRRLRGEEEKAGIEVDRKTVSLNAPINRIGEFTMLIKLTSKVRTELKVIVTASEVVKESIEEEVVEETVEA